MWNFKKGKSGRVWHEWRLIFQNPPGAADHREGQIGERSSNPAPKDVETLESLKARRDSLLNELAEKESALAGYKGDLLSRERILEEAAVKRRELADIQLKIVETSKLLGRFLHEFDGKVENIVKRVPELEKLRTYAEEHATITDLEGGWEWMDVKREEKNEYMAAMFLKKGKNPNEYALHEIMKCDKFRWHVRLGYIFPPAVYRVRVTDEKTNEVRVGTRAIRGGKIGYFTNEGRGAYIAIGENVGAFSGTKIEIMEVWEKDDPRCIEQAKKEQEWWDREKRGEIIGSTLGDAERWPGSARGPGAIPTKELQETSRRRLMALKVPAPVIKQRVEARNHYGRLEGQFKKYGIATEGLKSDYTTAVLLEKGEEVLKKFQYDFQFEKRLREGLKGKISSIVSGASIKEKIEQMQAGKRAVDKFPVVEAGLVMQIDISNPESPQIKWLEQTTGKEVADLEDYLDRFVIEKTSKESQTAEETPLIKFVKILQNGGKFEGLQFRGGYQLNLSHLGILEKLLTDKKYRERIRGLLKGKEMIGSDEFIAVILNDGAEEATNLPPDPHRRARFTSQDILSPGGGLFVISGNERVAKPPIDIGGERGLRRGKKRGGQVRGIIIHDTVSGWSAKRTAGYFTHAKYTPHYAISRDGKIIQIMPDDEIAPHAGGGTARRGDMHGSVNGQTIGIDLVNWNKRNGKYDLYTPLQYKSLARLTAYLVTKYKIPMEQIMGHRVVDAHCRRDPSDVFNWHWYQKEVQRLIRTGATVELAAN
ncbi:N-acetylmuramoyl-L-alanine amidase [Candidatus Peregrinibacteria bacterium]|nr:N-acetylmuramoyl-L-alanine amidase [Candidatus Peregrinibacteria bacterium]